MFVSGLWALVNNVSWAAFGEIEWVPIEVFRKTTDVNFISTVRVTQLFLPLIRKTKGNASTQVIIKNVQNESYCRHLSPL